MEIELHMNGAVWTTDTDAKWEMNVSTAVDKNSPT